MEKCAYCEGVANFQLKNKKFCCEVSHNKCPSIRLKNSNGLSKAHNNGKMKYDHFDGKRAWNKGKTAFSDERLFANNKGINIFSQNSNMNSEQLKKTILKERLIPYKCIECDNEGIWREKKISLELDHINGDTTDNRLENLRFLCPNCHSQTPTFRSRNKNKKIVTDELLLESLKNNKNIHKALRSVGLAGAANYKRVYTLKIKNDL